VSRCRRCRAPAAAQPQSVSAGSARHPAMKLLSHLPKQGFWLYLGPVLNVLTLLLIFFLLGSTFVVRSGVHVTLPENASRLTGFDHAHVITVSTASDPVFYLDGKPATVKTLKDDLVRLKRESRKIIIHADVMAP